MTRRRLAVIAVGGNALIRSREASGLVDQHRAVIATADHVVDLIAAGWSVVVTHGNGPQVGFILRRSEIAGGEVPVVGLPYAVGDTQGAIGFMFQNALGNAMRRRDLDHPVVALVTQTVVERQDPAFAAPDKPIGAHMDRATAERLAAELGWSVAEDSGRGWRRVVASPAPREIVEAPLVDRLVRDGVVVIACGGGGIAVARDADGSLAAIDAVIDKDRTSALLAARLAADMLLIPTGVERVAVHFGTPLQRWLDRMTAAEARAFLAEGHFGAGSMAPKIETMLAYLDHCPDGTGLITTPEAMGRAVAGEAGTRFVR